MQEGLYTKAPEGPPQGAQVVQAMAMPMMIAPVPVVGQPGQAVEW